MRFEDRIFLRRVGIGHAWKIREEFLKSSENEGEQGSIKMNEKKTNL
jgi:hypothetical protein